MLSKYMCNKENVTGTGSTAKNIYRVHWSLLYISDAEDPFYQLVSPEGQHFKLRI